MKKDNIINTTLDNKHNEIIKKFNNNENIIIPKLKKKY